MMYKPAYRTVCLALCLVACGEEASASIFENVGAPFRASLSEMGLDATSFTQETSGPTRVHRYQPSWPLWSSGSQKTRLVVSQEPSMAAPSPEDLDQPRIFVKTFAFAERLIETRFIRIGQGAPEYLSYMTFTPKHGPGCYATFREFELSIFS